MSITFDTYERLDANKEKSWTLPLTTYTMVIVWM